MQKLIIQEKDLANNPTRRIPICLVLDTSYSMRATFPDGTRAIDELNAGVDQFLGALLGDEVAKYAAEVAVISFNKEVKILHQFGPLDEVRFKPLIATGATKMGEAMTQAIDLVQARKKQYKDYGISYYQPWIVLMTDGAPTDDITLATEKVKKYVSKKKLMVYSIAIGPEAKLEALNSLSPGQSPKKLQGLKFRELFAWLSASVQRISQSMPGEVVDLSQGISDWEELDLY